MWKWDSCLKKCNYRGFLGSLLTKPPVGYDLCWQVSQFYFYLPCLNASVIILRFVIVNVVSTRGPFLGNMKILGGSLTALIFNLNTFNWSAGLVTGMGLVPRVTQLQTSAANRLIGKVVQSRRRPLLGPSPGWKCLLALSHLRHY